ncbi:MAG: methyl-accepting chemotaxis protein [Fimbriimonadales bacterium]
MRNWNKLSVIQGILFFSVALFVFVTWLNWTTIRHYTIGSEQYNQIETAKAIAIDVAPPPFYLIEASASVLNAVVAGYTNNTSEIDSELRRYRQLKKEFQERAKHWRETYKGTSLEPQVNQVIQTGNAWTTFVDNRIIPLIQNRNFKGLNSAKAESYRLFNAHRESVTLLLSVAEKQTSTIETRVVATTRSRQSLTAFFGLVMLAILLYTALVVVGRFRNILNSVEHLNQAFNRLAQGDLTVQVSSSSRDVLYKLAEQFNQTVRHLRDSFQTFTQTNQQMISEAQGVSQGIGEAERQSGQVATLVEQFAKAIQEFAQQVQNDSQAIIGQVMEVTQAAHEVAQGAENTAQAAQQGVYQMQSTLQSVRNLAHQAEMVQQIAQQVSVQVEQGRGALHQTNQAIHSIDNQTGHLAKELHQLTEMSSSITAILRTIEEIARQTNLLALNAAIEAAKAGEAGRGFAVVAKEIRDLAERSGKATQNIHEIIQEVQKKTERAMQAMYENQQQVREGVELANQTSTTLEAILSAIAQVNTQVDSTVNELERIQQATEQTLAEIEQIAAIAEQSSAASEQMLAGAETSTRNVQHMIEQSAAMSEQVSANAEEVFQVVNTQVENIRAVTRKAQQMVGSAEAVQFAIGRFRWNNDQGDFASMVPKFKQAHLRWVERVEKMVYEGVMIPRNELVSHKNCALGQWYYSVGMATLGHLQTFKDIEPLHARLHQIASLAVDAMEKGDKSSAEHLLAEMRGISQQIVAGLDRLAEEAKSASSGTLPKAA